MANNPLPQRINVGDGVNPNWKVGLNLPAIHVLTPNQVTTDELSGELIFDLIPSDASSCLTASMAAFWSSGIGDNDALTEMNTGLPLAFAAVSYTDQLYTIMSETPGVTVLDRYMSAKYDRLGHPADATTVPPTLAVAARPFGGPADQSTQSHAKLAMQIAGLSSLAKSDTGVSIATAHNSLVSRYNAICTMSGTIPNEDVKTRLLALPEGILDKSRTLLWSNPTLARAIVLTVSACAKSAHQNKSFKALSDQMDMIYRGAMMTIPKTIRQFVVMDTSTIKLHSAFISEWRKLKAAINFLETEYGDDYPYCRILALPHNTRLNAAEYPFLASVTAYWLNTVQAGQGGQRSGYQSKLGGQYATIIRELSMKQIDTKLMGTTTAHLTEEEANDFGLDHAAIQRGLQNNQGNPAAILTALRAAGILP